MKFNVKGQCIQPIDTRLTVSGTLNYYEDEFVFDDSWEGYVKTAVYTKGNTYALVVLEDNKARVPYAVLEEYGYIKVGVYGVKTVGTETVRIPTIWSDLIRVSEGCKDGVIIPDPDPEIYEQILIKIAKIEREIQGLDGGETNQALVKDSDDDDDYSWHDIANSVNNKTGDVVLDATDVEAVPEENYLTNLEIEEIINSVA